MHLIRYEHDGSIHHGILDSEEISEIEGDFFGDLSRTGTTVPLSAVTLKAPTVPTKIVNLAGN